MKLENLSKVDLDTLYLRGGSGNFKPENPIEVSKMFEALASGATVLLEWWLIEDYDRAKAYRLENFLWVDRKIENLDLRVAALLKLDGVFTEYGCDLESK